MHIGVNRGEMLVFLTRIIVENPFGLHPNSDTIPVTNRICLLHHVFGHVKRGKIPQICPICPGKEFWRVNSSHHNESTKESQINLNQGNVGKGAIFDCVITMACHLPQTGHYAPSSNAIQTFSLAWQPWNYSESGRNMHLDGKSSQNLGWIVLEQENKPNHVWLVYDTQHFILWPNSREAIAEGFVWITRGNLNLSRNQTTYLLRLSAPLLQFDSLLHFDFATGVSSRVFLASQGLNLTHGSVRRQTARCAAPMT